MTKQKSIIAYKAFDENLKCRGHQYEIGKSYEHKGDIKICENGFHACENPLDVLNYYDLVNTKFARVELNGEIKKDGDKSVCSKISIIAELRFPDFVAEAIKFVWQSASSKKVKDSSKLAASGDSSQLAASGQYSQLAASGDSSQLAASGQYSQLAASGQYSQLAASGQYSKLAASGYGSQLEITEKFGVSCGVERASKVKGIKGTLVCLVYYDDKTPIKFVTGKIGTKGLKENIWYELDSTGKFVEVK